MQELIKNGALEARKASGVWLINKDSVNARLRSVTKTGGRPRRGHGKSEIAFTLMNRTHEVAQLVYSTSRKDFTHIGDDVSLSIASFAPEGKAAAAKPDNTSDGNLQKYWTCEGGRRILHKAGAHLNQEPYNELVATALHRRILNACDYVPYSLEGTGTSALSTCDVFLTDEEEYVPAFYVNQHANADERLTDY